MLPQIKGRLLHEAAAYRRHVADELLCVHHAKQERLVAASGVAAGMSTCGAHESSGMEPLDGFLGASCLCCRTTRHRAFFIFEGEPLCIRHAADAAFPDDDMGAHDMAHAAYITLNELGMTDTY